MKKQFRSFEEARQFVVSLHLKNNKEWRLLIKSNKKPNDIPSNPDSVYKDKGWTSWGNWLGTGSIGPRLRKHKSFTDARRFVHSLELRNQLDWAQFCKSGKKPDNIPSDPGRHYKSEFKSYGDWLGTGRVANRNKKYRTFEESRKLVHLLKLKNVEEWNQYCTSGNKPDEIPNNPQRTYKQDWISWGDWLGTGKIATHLRKYKTFQEARNYIHVLGLKNQKSWFTFTKSNKLPDNIPKNPNQVYKDKGWVSWGNFLGTKRIGSGLRKYISFEDARKFVHSLGLTGANEWREFAKSDKMFDDIPKNPNQVYKDKGWRSWGDWTGTGTIASYNIKFREFEKAREFAHTLGLKTANEWRTLTKSGKFPKDIPHGPNLTYKNKGWISWGDFLGTGTLSTIDISQNWLPWKEAKILYQKIAKENNLTTKKQWQQYIKTHKLPKGLTAYPEKTYTEKRSRKIMK